jgi:hypothetical protein
MALAGVLYLEEGDVPDEGEDERDCDDELRFVTLMVFSSSFLGFELFTKTEAETVGFITPGFLLLLLLVEGADNFEMMTVLVGDNTTEEEPLLCLCETIDESLFAVSDMFLRKNKTYRIIKK